MEIKDEQHAQEALAALSKFYRQPVMPVRAYCDALETWSRVFTAKHPDAYRAHQLVAMAIRKSNLLARLIYGGEKLRTTPCPEHKGEWSGCRFEPCEHGCNYGANITGWLK